VTPSTGDGTENANAIDTSISVLPRGRLGGKHGKHEVPFPETSNAGWSGRADVSARRQPLRRPAFGIARNAIGVVIARPDGPSGRNDGRRNFAAFLHAVARAGPGTANRTVDRWAKMEGHLDRPAANGKVAIKRVDVSRGVVNGSTVARAGFAPSGIGGPSGVIAGINGSTIRPKH